MSKRLWLVRVAQEFKIERETADEALAFLKRAGDREMAGAELLDSRGAICEIHPDDEATA